MKPPKDIWDRSPLEQEPFLTEFEVRKLATSKRGDNWFAPLAKDIRNDSSQRSAAVQWSKLAFAPEDKTSRKSNPRPTLEALLASIEVFVQFYWALYNNNEKGALDVVNRERRDRKFGYMLALPVPRPQSTQAGGATQPQPTDAVSYGQTSAPWRSSSGSRGTRAPKKGRGGKLGEAGAHSGKNKDAAGGPNGAAVAGGTGSIKPTVQSGDSEQAVGMDSTVAEGLGPSSDVAVCESYAAMDFPEEDKGIVVFREDSDAASFVAAHSHPHGSSSPIVVTREESSDNHVMETSPSPTVVSQSTPSDISGTTAVEVADPAAAEPPAQSNKPRHKKARKEASQQPTRQRQPRAAANQERLSQLAKGEFEYHSKAKRGLIDDLEDLTASRGGSQPSVTAPPARRAKKSKKRAPSEDRDDPMTGPAAGGESDQTLESVSAPLPSCSRTIPAPSINTGPASGLTSNPSRRTKKAKERKIQGIDVSVRPSKRQRGKDSAANPTGASGDAASQEERRRKKPSTAYTEVRGGPTASSPSVPPLGLPNGPETALHQPSDHSAPSIASSLDANRIVSESRKMVKRPRPQGVRPGLPGLGVPIAAPAPLGIPATLAEMDRIINDVATGAEMDLNNTATVVDEWMPDLEAQDAPPDSDDEEDIPLSQAVSSRREVRDAVASVSACEANVLHGAGTTEELLSPDNMSVRPDHRTLPDACPSSSFVPSSSAGSIAIPAPPRLQASILPLTLASSIAGPPPPVIPNLVGSRVPRPIPPSAHQKKPLTARPTIWAKSRQEVCESFDWFRSYQSGVYHANDIVKGYLLSAFSASRDIFARDGRLIISHGGGKAESLHSAKGRATVQKASDQEEGDKSVRALLRTHKMGRPVALVIDDRYALFPYDLSSKPDCTYVVLGFYHIAHAWAERQPADNNLGFVIRYKFAFEWCDKQPEPWWIKPDKTAGLEACSVPAPPGEDNPIAQRYPCPSCKMESPLVYEQGWMCLRPSCSAFWTFPDGRHPPQDLAYSDAFINASCACDHEYLEDIAPQPPTTQATDGVITSRRFTKGWHCKKCGRLSCRYKWQHWECQSCGSALQAVGKSRNPNEFRSQQNTGGFMHHKVADDSGILASHLMYYRVGNTTGNYHVYVLPENRGRIYLILGNPWMNQVANEIFQEYQEQAVSGELQFRRWPLRSHQCRGELLTNYFSQNTGEPYQYVGGTANTIPFDGAPSAVIKARDLIQSRMMSVMQAESQPYRFNEVLSAAYMEEQRMAFHSDAENGLGPRVASLSLGSAALMHFRPLKKYRKEPGGGQKCNALTLFLKHGDVLIMDGAEVQEYYEHTVVPLNFRIAATARYINNRNH
ncbi:hypothetical protein LXA43DRAFT_731491 [Ganoderma leucocontextum]|nr:hypothetical protein LXA43DRAFT_731491 [Ganoderma leucocontextum]